MFLTVDYCFSVLHLEPVQRIQQAHLYQLMKVIIGSMVTMSLSVVSQADMLQTIHLLLSHLLKKKIVMIMFIGMVQAH